MRILIVEDEKKVARALEDGLRRARYRVSVAPTGEQGFFLLNAEKFDLVILDLGLPGRDGLEILRTMRSKQITTPVLVLTARDSVESRVQGLESGADDYLTKPFAFPELVARVHSLLRRSHIQQPGVLRLADLQLDVSTKSVTRGEEEIVLTARELEMLEYLLRHKNAVVSREMLARDIWKVPMRATPLDNVIDVHIAHLRRKIDNRFEPKLLHTVRGLGFSLRRKAP